MVQIRWQKLILSVHLSIDNQKAEGKKRDKKRQCVHCLYNFTDSQSEPDLRSYLTL